jgi:hypothetical protein
VSDARLISKATSTASQDHYWMLSTFDVAALRVRLKAGGDTVTLISPPNAVTVGEWYHVAATYDGATLRLWANGVEIAASPHSGAVDANDTVAAALGNQPQGGNPFDGRLDDVFVYDTALDASEIALLMSLDGGPPSLIFSDGFESGDLSAWDASLP